MSVQFICYRVFFRDSYGHNKMARCPLCNLRLAKASNTTRRPTPNDVVSFYPYLFQNLAIWGYGKRKLNIFFLICTYATFLAITARIIMRQQIYYIFRNMYVSNFDILHRVSVIWNELVCYQCVEVFYSGLALDAFLRKSSKASYLLLRTAARL